jgi:RHS repeat-associated protein
MELILQHPEFATATFYVRDASGNVMAVYKTSGTTNLTLEEQHIYGSSRLGIFKKDKTIKNKARALGERRYELTDHLGNVRVVMSDYKRTAVIVLSATDYYPFGMVARTYTSPEEYRYGFNGKELDTDIGGASYDYGFRIYDARIAKFLSVDPLSPKYPYYTPYQFAANRPIQGIDLDGKEFYQTTIVNADGSVEKQWLVKLKITNSSTTMDDIEFKARAAALKAYIESSYSGVNANGEKVTTKVELEFIADPNSLSPKTDFYVEFNDGVFKHPLAGGYTVEDGLFGITDRIGDMNANRFEVAAPTPVQNAMLGLGIEGDCEQAFALVDETGAHEFGHGTGLRHENDPNNPIEIVLSMDPKNNLMNAHNFGNTKLTSEQLSSIETFIPEENKSVILDRSLIPPEQTLFIPEDIIINNTK